MCSKEAIEAVKMLESLKIIYIDLLYNWQVIAVKYINMKIMTSFIGEVTLICYTKLWKDIHVHDKI